MKFKLSAIAGVSLLLVASCTKLSQTQNGSIVFGSGNSALSQSLLNTTYTDLGGLMNNQDQIFSLEENTSDECLVPTRGGDWDDNGVWRVLHAHTWTATHGQFQSVFTGLGKMESDALATLASNPTPVQADEALFLRSEAQWYFLDLFGQVPYRQVSDYNAVTAAPVLQPAAAIDTLVATLNGIISRNLLPASNAPYKASTDAAKFMLMKVLLNKGAYLNRAAPTFDQADMASVIALGTSIINSGKYALNPVFFNQFAPNSGATSTEAIWAWPNFGTANYNGISSIGIDARWMMTLHYNSYDKNGTYGSAGWNGFSTVADFYNTFEGHGDATPDTKIDTTKDQRIGGRFYPGVTDVSGLKPGLLAGQQYNEQGQPETDRHGNPLKFMPAVNLIETDKNTLELTGIRIVKYPPDYPNYNSNNQRNQLQMFRYADVILMVAEAEMRNNDATTALTLVNTLRQARGASQWTSLTLVNPANVDDPNTLLAERGRELYWESWRRQDLIRFGVFLKPWALKTADDPKNYLFPIPSDQIVANPNIKQNSGY